MKNIFIGVLAVALVLAIASSLYKEDVEVLEPALVTNFEECIAAGNPAMESYPRQCSHQGENFVEVIDEELPPVDGGIIPKEETAVIECDPKNRPEICTMEYAPVCGLVQVQCITTPCDPVPQTFSTGCTACSNQNVISYTEGECKL